MNAFSIESYKNLLRELQSGIAERIRAERELVESESPEDLAADEILQDSIRVLQDRLKQGIADADEQVTSERKSAEDQYQSESATINADYRKSMSQGDVKFEAAVEAIEEAYKENCWLMQSILDDKSQDSPKFQFDKLKTQLQQTQERLKTERDEVKSLLENGVALVEKRRQSVEEELEPVKAPKHRDEALEKFNAAAKIVREKSEQLKRQTIPRLFGGWTFLLVAILIWGGLFAPLYFLVDLQPMGLMSRTSQEWLWISLGAPLVISIVVLLILYTVAVRQTAAAIAPLQQSASEAAAHYQHWMKFAKAEMQKAEQDFRKRHAAIVEHREKSLQKFALERETKLKELDQQRLSENPVATQARDKALQQAAARRDSAQKEADASHTRSVAAHRDYFEREKVRVTREHEQKFGARSAKKRELRNKLEQNWKTVLERLRQKSESLQAACHELFPDWEQIANKGWWAPDKPPVGVRLGDYQLSLADIPDAIPEDQSLAPFQTKFDLPAVLEFPAPLLLKANGPGRTEAIQLLQDSMLQLLTQLRPGDVRFTVLDPVGLGENFSSFMNLADFDEMLISHRIWTESTHIDTQLSMLTEHMENVFQKYLRNEFESIEQYNESAGEVAEPYRVLVVANFPVGFSDRAAQRLISIATSGPRCGVHTLISYDTQQRVPHGFDISLLEADMNVLEWKEDGFHNVAFGSKPPPLRIAESPTSALLGTMIKKAGEASKLVRRVQVAFRRIAPTKEEYWKSDSRDEVDVPLGRAGATKLQHLRLGKGTSQHVLMAGKTGSGKSTLLHVMITDLALRYSPDELEYYLIDFKKGVEFKTYANHKLPHARVISIESDREFGTSVLERLDRILVERGELFREVGAQNIKAFRDARPDVKMPRILLLVDEFQEFFTEEDKYSQIAAQLIDRLVRQGRAFGMHVMLGSQSLGGSYSLPRTTIGQMAIRIALQSSEADAHLILSEDNSAARLLNRPGEAIYNDANGRIEGNNPFQVAWLDDSERDEYLAEIETLSQQSGETWPEAIVFEGNVPADPLRNPALCEMLDGVGASQTGVTPQIREPHAWLGEAVAITGPSMITFPKSSGANLLIVGQEPTPALGMMSNLLLVLASETRHLVNGSDTPPCTLYLFAKEFDSGNQPRWDSILKRVSYPVRVSTQPNEAAPIIAEIAAEITRRQTEGSGGPPIFVFIDDLSRLRDLRKSDDDFGFGGFDKEKTVSPGQAFGNILRDGPPLGVHTIVWCDSYNNVDRWFSRQTLREFEMRVVFQMSSGDSSNLIDSPVAARLGPNRALLYSESRGTTQKFRPYGPASAEWMQWLDEHLPKVNS